MEEIQAVTRPANPFCLALSGGIACGKSTVGAMLETMGLRRIDSDQIARQVVLPGTPGLKAVVDRFGQETLAPDGSMDRRAMGRLVFSDPQARRDLERIVHPLVWQVMADEIRRAGELSQETVFEIPLLFENGNEGRFSVVWVVIAEREQSLLRLMARDGLSREEAEARHDSQMSVAEKARRACYVIHNGGNLADLEQQVLEGLRLWREGRRRSQ